MKNDQALTASQDYLSILEKLNDTTNQLVETLSVSDMDTATRLIASREDLCAVLADSTERLSYFIKGLDSSSDSTELKPYMDRAKDLQASIKEKQLCCEHLLSQSMDECKALITGVRRQKNLQNAYSKSSNANRPVFLDNRY